MALLVISSEMPELLGLADRVLVMADGRIVADLPRARPARRASSTSRWPTICRAARAAECRMTAETELAAAEPAAMQRAGRCRRARDPRGRDA